MTRDNVKMLLARIDISYPNWKPKDLTLLIDTWFEMIGEYSYEEMLIALKTYISTDRSGFAPSIGQLIGTVNDIKAKIQGEDLSEMQAWSLVRKAMCDSIYHAQERFDELPEKVRRAVGSPQNLKAWGIEDSYNENVAQSHFINSYRRVCEDAKKINAMPVEVRTLIAQATQNLIGKEDYD